jgi:hypothetical protein
MRPQQRSLLAVEQRMTSTRRFITGFAFAISLLAVVALFWQSRLRHCAEMERTATEHCVREISGELRASEQQNAALERQTVALQKPIPTSPPVTAPAAPDTTAKAAINTARQTAIAEARRRQRVRGLMNLEMTLRPKFEALGLSGEQWHRYQTFSLELGDREAELRRAGKRGMTDEEFEAFVRTSTTDVVGQMRSLIGDAAYEELQQFQVERAHPVRKTVQALAQQLMFSSAPLETLQKQQLTQLLNARGTGAALKEKGGVLPSDVLIEVEKLLTPLQVQALRRLQSQYQLFNDTGAIARQLEAARIPPPATGAPKTPGG